MRRLVGLILFLFLSVNFVTAQDTLLLMSGAKFPCKITLNEGFQIEGETWKKNGKSKISSFHKNEVFSILQNGKEEIIYFQDLMLGDEFNVNEMRIFIAGETDARYKYNSKPTFWTGVGVGFAGSVLAKGGVVVTFTPPILYTLLQLAPRINIKEHTITNKNHQYNDIYLYGYEKVARSRKVSAAMKGSALGMLAGAALYFIFPDQITNL